jgi:hypothetical protein
MIDGVDQHRHAERVGQEDELLTCRCAGLPGAGQEVDGALPLIERELNVAHESVQVLDKARHNPLSGGSRASPESCQELLE